MANIVILDTTGTDEFVTSGMPRPWANGEIPLDCSGRSGAMIRLWMPLVSTLALCGCAQMRFPTAGIACDDCLPPPVAGRYFYFHHLDDLVTTCTAQRCARRDLKEFADECDGLTRDFADGYIQAYIDLAAGRPACVPAVPPKKYWHAWHRSCAGRDAVEQWYAGYRVGLDNGVNGGVSRFHRIVPNLDDCCVSAAYVSPYAALPNGTGIIPADRQTVSHADDSPR